MKCNFCGYTGEFTEGEHDEDCHELMCPRCNTITELDNDGFNAYCAELERPVKVWFRLGCDLQLTPGEISMLRENRLSSADWDRIFARGVQVDGDSYPYDDDMGLDDGQAVDFTGDRTLYPGK